MELLEYTLKKIISLKAVNRRTRAMEIRLQRKIDSLFNKAFTKTLSELKAMDYTPSDATTRRLIIKAVEDMEEQYLQVLSDEGIKAAEQGRRKAISSLQRQGISVSFSSFSKDVRDRIKDHIFEAGRLTMSRIKGDVMANLADSYELGLGIDDAAERLAEEFGKMQDYQLKRIARTEINTFQNEGAHATMEEMGVKYIMWITAKDERVRDGTQNDADHVKLHGQIIRRGDRFENDLKHPHDRTGPIKQWINCRCTEVPFIMPHNKRPPEGRSYFYESELEDIA